MKMIVKELRFENGPTIRCQHCTRHQIKEYACYRYQIRSPLTTIPFRNLVSWLYLYSLAMEIHLFKIISNEIKMDFVGKYHLFLKLINENLTLIFVYFLSNLIRAALTMCFVTKPHLRFGISHPPLSIRQSKGVRKSCLGFQLGEGQLRSYIESEKKIKHSLK